jgi:hypothetical protein
MDWRISKHTDLIRNKFQSKLILVRRGLLLGHRHTLKSLLEKVNLVDFSNDRIQATDPRDRVFALLGVAKDEVAKDIAADYTLSFTEAYIVTAKALLRHGHDDILSLCRNRHACPDLPSWVPDWSAPIRKPWSTWYNERLFNASGKTSLSMGMIGHQLVLDGVFVDTIEQLGRPWSIAIPTEELFDYAAAGRPLRDFERFLLQRNRYTEEEKMEGMWRIPVGDTSVINATRQLERAGKTSGMKTGYEVMRLYTEDKAEAKDLLKNGDAYSSYICQMGRMHDSSPFLSRSGYVGLCPMEARPSDSIVIFLGARVPYVVRKVADSDTWSLVGEIHVHGIMDGEFMTQDPLIEKFTLC